MEPIQLEPFCEISEEAKSEISKSYQIKNEMERVEMFKGLKKTIVGGRQFIRKLSKSIVRKNNNSL